MSKYLNDSEALIGEFPYSLARDDDKEKLAEIIADKLTEVVHNTDKALIFPSIDTLPEEVLDILAYDFKIEWYEYQAPVWNKRQAVKDALKVHRYKGTKYAVETALRSMFNSIEVKEWFEYEGEPYHFKATVYGSTTENLKKLYQKIDYAKNLRSVMDAVRFILIPDKPFEVFIGIKNVSRKNTSHSEIVSTDNEMFKRGTGVSAAAEIISRRKIMNADLQYGNGENFGRLSETFAAVKTISSAHTVKSKPLFFNSGSDFSVISGCCAAVKTTAVNKRIRARVYYDNAEFVTSSTGISYSVHSTALIKKVYIGGLINELE